MTIQTRFSEQSMMAEINVTPLVDVMLVLLIIFIVTAPLLMQGIPIILPKKSATPTLTLPKPVQLSIGSDRKIYLNKEPVERAQLKTKLQALHANAPELAVQLLADERTQYGEVARIMAIVQQAGITKLVFVTVSE